MHHTIVLFQQMTDLPRINRKVGQFRQRYPYKIQIDPLTAQLVIAGKHTLERNGVLFQMNSIIKMHLMAGHITPHKEVFLYCKQVIHVDFRMDLLLIFALQCFSGRFQKANVPTDDSVITRIVPLQQNLAVPHQNSTNTIGKNRFIGLK